MFPMISTLEEVQRLKRVVKRTKDHAARQNIAFADESRSGVMLEVRPPLCASRICSRSISSASLQRLDPVRDGRGPRQSEVAQLLRAVQPPVMKLLYRVIRACRKARQAGDLVRQMARPRSASSLSSGGPEAATDSPPLCRRSRNWCACSALRPRPEIAPLCA